MNRESEKSVLIVDDHPFIRSSIIKELESNGSYQVCGEVGTKTEALQLVIEKQPDFLIVDLSLEDGSGFDILEYVQEHYPSCSSIVVSMHEEPAYIEQAIQYGARGYIFKRESVSSVVQALQDIQEGKIFMSQRVAKVLVHQHQKEEQDRNLEDLLTRRELEIFRKIGDGYTRTQIAELFFISARTVDSHFENLKSKLDCSRMSQLTRKALQFQLAEKKLK